MEISCSKEKPDEHEPALHKNLSNPFQSSKLYHSARSSPASHLKAERASINQCAVWIEKRVRSIERAYVTEMTDQLVIFV